MLINLAYELEVRRADGGGPGTTGTIARTGALMEESGAYVDPLREESED
jgi:hypothetical protein